MDDLIKMVQRQTNYTADEARDKLAANECDPVRVIRAYLVPSTAAATTATIAAQKRTRNQQTFFNFRQKLDADMREYTSYIEKEAEQHRIEPIEAESTDANVVHLRFQPPQRK